MSTDSNDPSDPNEPENSLPPGDQPASGGPEANSGEPQEADGAETNGTDDAEKNGAGAAAPPAPGRIIELPIEQELKDSYLTYAMSVIVVAGACPTCATG